MTTGDQMDKPPYQQGGSFPAPREQSAGSVLEERLNNAHKVFMHQHEQGYATIHLAEGVQDALACIREQQAALKEITDAFELRCGDWENPEFNECYNEARAVLAKWRIE